MSGSLPRIPIWPGDRDFANPDLSYLEIGAPDLAGSRESPIRASGISMSAIPRRHWAIGAIRSVGSHDGPGVPAARRLRRPQPAGLSRHGTYISNLAIEEAAPEATEPLSGGRVAPTRSGALSQHYAQLRVSTGQACSTGRDSAAAGSQHCSTK